MRAGLRVLVVALTMALAVGCDDDEEVVLDAGADRPAGASDGGTDLGNTEGGSMDAGG